MTTLCLPFKAVVWDSNIVTLMVTENDSVVIHYSLLAKHQPYTLLGLRLQFSLNKPQIHYSNVPFHQNEKPA